MSRTRLPIVLHLTPEEIYRRYRACRTGVEKTHWHLIWLLTRARAAPGPGPGRRPGRPDAPSGPAPCSSAGTPRARPAWPTAAPAPAAAAAS